MEIINTADGFAARYTGGRFDLGRWREYIDARVPGARELCLRDAQETMDAGYSWEAYFLPVLNAVPAEPEKLERALRSFREVTEGLDGRIIAAFGKSVDVDVVCISDFAAAPAGSRSSAEKPPCCWGSRKFWSSAGTTSTP